jgi:hypothetical protein
MEVVPLRNMT